MEKIILTGDRPTGRLHLGHYVGSLKSRVEIQNNGDYFKMFIMIADAQALTDNFEHPEKVRDNVIEVALDYLAVGLDPDKINMFVQSEVPGLTELTYYYTNFVTLARLERNPTVKSELLLRKFNESIPVGFLNYPISQAADITAFKANCVPVGDDQLPMIEQTREIVRSFNHTYGNILVEPDALIPESANCSRLPGIDGKNKMSKSLGNCIYLGDEEDVVKQKIMMMYTDPKHLKVEDPGRIKDNVVFTYLDIFCKDEDFKKYLPEYHNLNELKKAYEKGGVGDILIKKFLNNILQEFLKPIREKRKELEKNIEYVYHVLEKGTIEANKEANKTLKEVKKAMKIDYFENDTYLKELVEKYKQI